MTRESKPARFIVRFEVCDLGIDAPDYFQGFGTSFTSFTDSCYGIGDNPREALSDALENMAQGMPSGAYTDALEIRILEAAYGDLAGCWRGDAPPTLEDIPDSPGALDDWKEENEDEEGNPPEDMSEAPELYYHIGIRWTCEPEPLNHIRDDEGKLPSFAWPGGYPIYYLVRDYDSYSHEEWVSCPECANNPSEPLHIPTAHDVNWEDASLYCEACNRRIESAYADPDEPDDDDVTTSDHCRFYQHGKLVLEVGPDDDHAAALRAWMEREQFWPDVWFISDHGNAHRIDVSK